MKNEDIIVDSELESLLPSLTGDENTELLKSIAKDGFTDPIIVWLNHGILVDGHNRHRIWRDVYASDVDMAPDIVEKPFGSLDDVKEFMLHRQLGRRNLTDAMKAVVALKLKPMIAARAKEKQLRKPADSVPTTLEEQPLETMMEVAKSAGLSHGTVRKVEAVMATDNEPLKQDMLADKVSINAAYRSVKATKTQPTAPPSAQERHVKPETYPDVTKVLTNIQKKTRRLFGRNKRKSSGALDALPKLERELRSLSRLCAKAADIVADIVARQVTCDPNS